MGRLAGPACWLALLLVGGGCSSTPDSAPASDRRDSGGVLHTLRAGENVYRLSRFYGVTEEAIVRANQLADITALSVGQELWIPGATKTAPSQTLGGSASGTQRGHSSNRRSAGSADSLGLAWPVRGKLSSRFGWRNGRRHDGIDIPAKRGTPVYAAQAGRVIHSGGGLGDYGKVVIIKHAGSYSTVYAHNDRLRVRKGQFIEKGDVLGTVGTSGNASGPHVHFEVRRDRKPLDPLLYLP
jgi:hypothetical protein